MFAPMLALALWTFLILGLNLVRRVRAVRARKVAPRYFKTYEGDAPENVTAASRNFSNLFETPVLFYVACVLALVTENQGTWFVALAWAFVLMRVLHSIIHVTSNHVYSRMAVFAGSILVLAALWILLAQQLL